MCYSANVKLYHTQTFHQSVLEKSDPLLENFGD